MPPKPKSTKKDTSVGGKKRKAAEKAKEKKKTAPAAKKMKKAPLASGMVLVEKRPYRAHGYKPTKTQVDREKTITFKKHLDCVWAVVQDAWTKLCDDVDVPANEPARKHLYLPGKIMIYSEPKLWDELVGPDKEVKEIHDFRFNRNQTIAAALDFAGSFLSLTLDLNGGFQGEDHVRRKCDFPKSWSESKRDKYAEAFDAITRKINDVREDGAAWSLCPHLGDKRTCVVVQTIDRVGGVAR